MSNSIVVHIGCWHQHLNYVLEIIQNHNVEFKFVRICDDHHYCIGIPHGMARMMLNTNVVQICDCITYLDALLESVNI